MPSAGFYVVAVAPFFFVLLHHTTSCSAFVVSGANVGGSRGDITMSIKLDPSGDSPSSSDGFRIGYLSDVEGHWDYFLECVERSNVLDWENVADCELLSTVNGRNKGVQFKRLILRPNTQFVYGGDTVDKGPGDIRLVRALVSLKKRYPDRVHLLVGNRDLNKLRLLSELSESDMKRDLDCISKPFWDPNAKSLKEYLLEVQLKSKGATDKDGSAESLDQCNSKAERLRYMLVHTMGCPETFEFRREEIQILTKIFGEYPHGNETHDFTPTGDLGDELSHINVADEDVVESFLYELSKEGSLYQYLKLSQIAAILGNTIFVHGAIDSRSMKFVPSLDAKFEIPSQHPLSTSNAPTDGSIVECVHEWVESLNDFLVQGLADFDERPEWNEDRSSRGGESLLAIQCRPAVWGRSVVCNSYADGGVIATTDADVMRNEALGCARERLDPLVFEGIASDVMDPIPANWLLDHGIQRIVVGHKPTGDCPAVLSSKYVGVEIVAVDTSYADRRDLDCAKRFGDGRGNAIAIVEITGVSPSTTRLEMSGVLACGTEYRNTFPRLSNDGNTEGDDDVGDPHLGTRLTGGWWIKAAVPPYYHLCRGSGRFVEYKIQPMQVAIEQLSTLNKSKLG